MPCTCSEINVKMSSSESAQQPPGAHPADRFSFSSEFASADLERQYRLSQLTSNRVTAKWCIIAIVIVSCLFISADYRLAGQSAQFLILLGMRALTIAVSSVALILLRRTQSPASFNGILWSWAMFIAFVTVFFNSTRPGVYSGPVIITVEMVLLTYCLLPLPLVLQILCASVNTVAGPLLHSWGEPAVQGMSQAAVFQAYVVANFLGIATSIQLQRRRRQLFVAALRQTELTAGLEQALAEIRTLRGILPICAHCKRVMNDAGAWEQIEDYVRKHTHAQFTHDICPECAKQHFGKYVD